MMNRSTKPKFTEGTGGWVNPDRLPSEALARLKLHLPSKIPEDKKAEFLQATSEAVDSWEQNKPQTPMPSKEISDRIEKMEDAAKALQQAIYRMQGEPHDSVYPHFDYLTHGSTPPVDLPFHLRQEKPTFGEVMGNTWDLLQVLRDTGKYARSHLQIERSAKPSLQSARQLAWWVITHYYGIFREYPPVYKNAWFPPYMTEIGEILCLETKFGNAMLSSIVDGMGGKTD